MSTPTPGHLDGRPACGWHFPCLESTCLRRYKVNPFAISRPAWGGVICGIFGQTNWLSSIGSYDIDIKVPLQIRIESDTLPVGRPVRRPRTRARLQKQVHDIGAICIANPDPMDSTALRLEGNVFAVGRVLSSRIPT